ncbi:hypothetical protein [Streptomyces sp. NPDC057623]|uniref:hypothetical protein n=1 Tax=Streptomyces sp. NPDC057623 TaxID=3346187 RepID=UPI0036CB39B1
MYVIAFDLTELLCAATHLALSRSRAGSACGAGGGRPGHGGRARYQHNQVYAMTFAEAAALAAAGGVLTDMAQSFTPTSGRPLLLTGFAVVALAGIGSVLPAGVTPGVLKSVSVSLFGGGWREVVVHLTFFLVLAVRPQGLFRKAAAG